MYHYDIPGSYAQCMLIDLPYGNPVYVSNIVARDLTAQFLNELHKNKMIGFIRATVICPEGLNIPVLPIHYEGKLVFPHGEFTGV